MNIVFYEIKQPNLWKYICVFKDIYVSWNTFQHQWVVFNNNETRDFFISIYDVKLKVDFGKKIHRIICKTEHGEFNLKVFENLVFYFEDDEQLMNFKLRV